jgi:hypothetical protein
MILDKTPDFKTNKTMKKYIISGLLGLLFTANSCKYNHSHEEVAPATGKLSLRVNTYANDSLYELNKAFYIETGDTMYASNLKFYLSQLKLRKKGTNEYVTLSDYYFLHNQAEADEANGRIEKITHEGNSHIKGVPVGEYDQVSFYVGIPQEKNHDTTNQTGALDPNNDMYWISWNEYIFFKLEGKMGAKKQAAFVYHITGDQNLKQIFVNLKNSPITITTSSEQKLNLKFYLDKVFSATSIIDVKTVNNVMGSGNSAVKIANNYASCFAFEKLENE